MGKTATKIKGGRANARTANMVFVKAGLTNVIEHLYLYEHLCLNSADVFQIPCLHKYPAVSGQAT
jgi:hypothetical protein